MPLMSRSTGFFLGVVAMVFAPAQATADPRAVVELFTSQGCSSCVAADVYMAELADRSDVIPLAFHVDYWDYLGWRDTFGSPENSARQRDYANAQGSRRIYTPQMIVNGTTDAVGSDRQSIESTIGKSRFSVPVALTRNNGKLVIQIGPKLLPGSRPTTIRLILFSSAADVDITRGENAGATIRYRNVVRAIRPIGMWDGPVVKVKLPEHELLSDGVDSYAVVVQEDLADGPGAILGAAQLTSSRR